MQRYTGVTAVVAALVVLAVLVPAIAFAIAPEPPRNLKAERGTEVPVIATIKWDAPESGDAVAYRVYVSALADSGYRLVDETTRTASEFSDGLGGVPYYIRVAAVNDDDEVSDFAQTGPVSAEWADSPHIEPTTETSTCNKCHSVHGSKSAYILRAELPTDTSGQASTCYICHSGLVSGAGNVATDEQDSFALSSGHKLEDAAESGVDGSCSSCHDVHGVAATQPMLIPEKVNGSTVDTTVPNAWCTSCHNEDKDWVYGDYPKLSEPSRDGSGYPVLGTWPGPDTYESSENAHALIPSTAQLTSSESTVTRSEGDCLYCHAAHRGPSAYDGLRAEYRPSTASTVATDQAGGTYAELCFECHGGETPEGFESAPVNIKQFATGATSAAGHRIKTAGGTLPVGAPLPCYDCHNPHGSSRGNASNISDERGRSLETSTAAGVRAFCFTCHSSGDGMVWDSGESTYTSVTAGKIEGLRRDGSDGSALAIPGGVSGHDSSDSNSCYLCHGQDYGANGYNVHNPGGGVSTGGVSCYTCHDLYQDSMDSSGTASTDSYHHVMGGDGIAGDTAFPSGSYPTGTNDVYCMSCHADHDQFNGSKSGNLRQDLTSSATTASTDYLDSGSFGICVSCHNVSLSKDTINQANDGTTATPKIVGGTGAGGFGNSSHSYVATSTFSDASEFDANCSKCHSDEQTKSFQTSTYTFGTHFSEVRHLLFGLGGTLSDPLAENECFRCHSQISDSVAGTVKSAVNKDWYGVAAMSDAAERVFAEFQLSGSTHPVGNILGSTVACASCHNVHTVSSSSPVSDPDNTYDTLAYNTTDTQAEFCLRCHDGSLPSQTVSGTAYVPVTVSIEPSETTLMDKSTYAARGHWTVNGSITAAISCATCHDKHGSSYPKLLGAYDVTSGTNLVNGASITGNDNTVCYACHAAADSAWPTFTRANGTSGYPTDGTWPGQSIFEDTTYGIHRTGLANVVWPGTSYAAGDCKNCHDVHGTANTYDELRGTYAASNYSTCLTCHDSDGPATTNVAQYYWISTGGTATNGTDRYSHSGDAGVATPCYDCHNPHGSASSYGLLVVTQISSTDTRVFGDTTGEFNLSTTQGVRDFCLSCHVINSSSNLGYSGTAGVSTTIQDTAMVDGYNRLAQLKITQNGNAHTSYTAGMSCLSSSCHSNVHAPY